MPGYDSLICEWKGHQDCGLREGMLKVQRGGFVRHRLRVTRVAEALSSEGSLYTFGEMRLARVTASNR
jgi:hypothetical protein